MSEDKAPFHSSAPEEHCSNSLFGNAAPSEKLSELRRKQEESSMRRRKTLWIFMAVAAVVALVALCLGVAAQRAQRLRNERLRMQQEAGKSPAPEFSTEELSRKLEQEGGNDGGWRCEKFGNCENGRILIEYIGRSVDELSTVSEALKTAVDVKPSNIGLSVRYWSNRPDRNANEELPAPRILVNGEGAVVCRIDGVERRLDLSRADKLTVDEIYALMNEIHARFYPEEQYPLQLAVPEDLYEPVESPVEGFDLRVPATGFSRD